MKTENDEHLTQDQNMINTSKVTPCPSSSPPDAYSDAFPDAAIPASTNSLTTTANDKDEPPPTMHELQFDLYLRTHYDNSLVVRSRSIKVFLAMVAINFASMHTCVPMLVRWALVEFDMWQKVHYAKLDELPDHRRGIHS